MPMHPQPRTQNQKAYEPIHHRHAETFRHSLRDGLAVSSALSLVIGLSCHHRQRNA
jgi:hypothetical protein